MAAQTAGGERAARLRRIARDLYEADAAGVVGVRPWSEVSAVGRIRWIVLANAYEHGRRLYEESSWAHAPGAVSWDELAPERRDAWMMEAITRPGGAW